MKAKFIAIVKSTGTKRYLKTVLAIAVSLPVLYVVSSGPVVGLADHLADGTNIISREIVPRIFDAYGPLGFFAATSRSGPGTLLRHYINLWLPLGSKIPEPPE
jgi:hypothetical protein